MSNETKEQLLQRLREKHAEGLLLWELENGLEMSPRQSALVIEKVKGHREPSTPNKARRVRGEHARRIKKSGSSPTP